MQESETIHAGIQTVFGRLLNEEALESKDDPSNSDGVFRVWQISKVKDALGTYLSSVLNQVADEYLDFVCPSRSVTP